MELYLVESRLIAYDTGERILSPAVLLEAIERMPLRSIFYHVHERGGGPRNIPTILTVAGNCRLRRLAGCENSCDRLLFFKP